MKKITKIIGGYILLTMTALYAHCQVPCGIYGDHDRVKAMLEDASTVAKAVTQINELSEKTDAQSANQLVRWVNNKESHAEKIISTISNYFLTQRVKSKQSDYKERLVLHHAVILAAMKAKQTVSVENAHKLTEAIQAIESYYLPVE